MVLVVCQVQNRPHTLTSSSCTQTDSWGGDYRQTEPTEWVNRMVTVVTPMKICMDPKDLNKTIKQEMYLLLTVEEVVSRMSNAKYFSVSDTNQRFSQIKVDEEHTRPKRSLLRVN